MKITVATKNPGKTREISRILRSFLPDVPLEIADLTAGGAFYESPEETGSTFMENAEMKARCAWEKLGPSAGLVLGEDSGLEVDYLHGLPGVRSHRFSGPAATDEQNNAALLKKLEGVPWEKRTARYRCAMVLVDGGAVVARSEGTVEGFILMAPRGTGGFGYDPLFYCPELGKAFGESSAEEKNKVSHRARALAGLAPVLRRMCQTQRENL
ncbi:MAG: RdgB/HAM1 family non-canonical purine NTP pyrophosphatase [Firmicutes bacterium]|nr:RdgB/HAM1 family non-canonical purine NTP pyrophosphatase [Candidatus Fermentithermobacillaceae bacterium]